MKISVSILSEKDNYKDSVNKLNKTSSNYLHLDIMDGSFTEKSSFDINEAKIINDISNKKLDVHIMSKRLDTILDDYINLKPEFITIHSEVGNIEKYIYKIKENNIKVGVALNPETDISILDPYLDKIDLVLIMSVVPGLGGQTFIKEVIPKLKEIKKIRNNYNFIIEVDGGINNETINFVKGYADIIVSGSYVTNSNNYQEKINVLLK